MSSAAGPERQIYVGTLSVVACAAFEKIVCDALVTFSKRKHHSFGNLMERQLDNFNARLKINQLQDDYLKKFGDRYQSNFKKYLEYEEKIYLKMNRNSLKAAYGNIIQCRHSFAHENVIPNNSSFSEMEESIPSGKIVMSVFVRALSVKL
ncbi:MAG: hypothetical protein IOC90_10630 [Methylocystis sp.]|nr:hypothetical protein [Methylocystis sp.]MCA3582758.1 hypothetical protein [Methylocystis sp.]MCA3588474.1 hypothetical protein [Methylocystis sp.]MCA3592055.1 hypothetical protein [Methylocystis sp.]